MQKQIILRGILLGSLIIWLQQVISGVHTPAFLPSIHLPLIFLTMLSLVYLFKNQVIGEFVSVFIGLVLVFLGFALYFITGNGWFILTESLRGAVLVSVVAFKYKQIWAAVSDLN